MLDTANSSITRIGRVLDEGKEIEKAADDGNLLTALAEEIPALVRDQVGSKNAYANVIRSYNDLVDFANSYNETY